MIRNIENPNLMHLNPTLKLIKSRRLSWIPRNSTTKQTTAMTVPMTFFRLPPTMNKDTM